MNLLREKPVGQRLKGIPIFLVLFMLLSNGLLGQNREKMFVIPVIATGEVGEFEYQSFVKLFSEQLPLTVFVSFFSDRGENLPFCDKSGCFFGITLGDVRENGPGEYGTEIRHGFSSYPVETGWIKIITVENPTLPEVGFKTSNRIIYKKRASESIAAVTSVLGMTPSKRILAGVARGLPTGISLVNPNEEDASVTIVEGNPEFWDSECRVELTIPSLNKITKFLKELSPNCDFVDSIDISSDIPIAAATLEIYLPEYKFISLPVVTLEEPF